MSEFVTIRHAKVAGTAQVPASTLRLHARRGWVRVDPPTPTPDEGDHPTAPAEGASDPHEED